MRLRSMSAAIRESLANHNGKTLDRDSATRFALLSLMIYVGLVYLIVFGAIALRNGDIPLCIFEWLCAALLAGNLFYLRKSADYAFASFCSVALMGFLFVYLFITGDPAGGGHLWILVFPLIAFFPLGRKPALAVSLAVLFTVMLFMLADRVPENALCYSCLFKIRFVAIYVVMLILVYIYERLRAMAHDMEAQKTAELERAVVKMRLDDEELKAMHKTLEDRVARRTSELVDANALLRKEIQERKKAEEERQHLERRLVQAQKMEAVGTLAGGVAHDLNNVLAGLVGYPDMLLMDMKPDDPLREPMEMIKYSGEHAAAMVQDLLALAQRDVSVMEVMQLNSIIEEFLTSSGYEKMRAARPEVHIRTELAPDLMRMEGVPCRMSRVIMCLVSNAVDAIKGPGEVTIATENLSLVQALDEPVKLGAGHYVLLSVSDNGEDLSGEARERIFEPFYTKKHLGRRGTGLGLALVWHTVKDHHGSIQVAGRPGGGTVFKVWFPATGSAVQKASAAEVAFTSGNREHILVIDDVDVQRHVAVEMLRRLNYRVDAVASGEEGLAFIRKTPVDLILLDMIMAPGMDGLETFRRIREINPVQKVVIVTGFTETEDVREALKLGAGAYVKKPYDMASISNAVRPLLAK
ncbi:MAG: response regulator [Kiritimatiellia bacterium]